MDIFSRKQDENAAGIPDFGLSIFLGNLLPENPCGEFAELDRNGGSGKQRKRENGADEEVSLQQLYPTENFALPFYFRLPSEISLCVFRRDLSQNTTGKRKARRIIRNSTEIYQKKDFQISENHVTIGT